MIVCNKEIVKFTSLIRELSHFQGFRVATRVDIKPNQQSSRQLDHFLVRLSLNLTFSVTSNQVQDHSKQNADDG